MGWAEERAQGGTEAEGDCRRSAVSIESDSVRKECAGESPKRATERNLLSRGQSE